MKNHTQNFKNTIKSLGKMQDVRITYRINGIVNIIDGENINSITPNYEASLLKSIMKALDLDSNIDIPINTEIKFEYGLLVNGTYEYLSYGNYIVYSSEKQEDTLSYKIKCYDKLLYSMKDYEHIEITYPCTIKQYLKALCDKIGLEFKESTFANQDRQIQNELFMTLNEDGSYTSMGYTYRDVLDQIAETTGGCICLTLDDKLEVRYINNTNDTIDEEYINDTNVNFGEKYGPINSVVLARAGESDRVYKKDQASIDENGLCELLISENQFMNFNDRSDYLPELTEKLFGVSYYLNDFVSTGIMYYDLLDMYNVEIYGKTYNCLMLNDEQLITQGLEENIHTDRPEKSETDYTKADKTDRKINQTNLIVDKQNQKIEGVISQIGDRSSKTTTITADIDGLNSKVENVADFTREKTQTENLYLDDIAQGEGYILNFKIYGDTNLFNSKKITICASKNVRGYGSDITLLTEDNQELLTEDGQEIIIGESSFNLKTLEIVLDDYLRNLKEGDNEYFDTLEIAQDGTITITRNIRASDDGTLYLLNEPIITVLDEKIILPSLKTGTYYFIEELSGLRYYANYIIQNDYSDTFLTKLELGTQITQNAESVKIAWNQISDFIQMMVFNNNVSLCIVDENNNVIASFDKEGEHFYKSGETIPFGEMGVQTVDDKQYISFSIQGEYEQDIENGMAWGIKTKSDGKFFPIFYIRDFNMGAKGSDTWSGSLVLTACDIKLDGLGTGIQTGNIRMYGDPMGKILYFEDTSNTNSTNFLMDIHANETYVDDNLQLKYKNEVNILGDILRIREYEDRKEINIFDKINYFKNQLGSNSFTIGNDNTYILMSDEASMIINNGGLNCWGGSVILGTDTNRVSFSVYASSAYFWSDLNVEGNVYANNISSDRRIKDNIQDSTIKALDIIKQIKHKQFDKKDDGKHYNIGYIAQEMEEIDPNFVFIRPATEQSEERYYINELPIIATLSKAIQEQQEQIEDLRQIINKQQEQINKILGGE